MYHDEMWNELEKIEFKEQYEHLWQYYIRVTVA